MANKISSKCTYAGSSFSDRSRFEAVYDGKPTNDQLSEEQRDLGYHPAGYGGPDYVRYSPPDKDGHIMVSWSCSGSCD